MKQINFKELNTEVEIDRFEPRDFSKEIGNSLHRAAENIPMADLARKIYYSEASIDIPEEDYEMMLCLLKKQYKKFIIDALVRSTVDNPSKDK